MDIKFYVVIPAYNMGQYIGEAIECLKKQTHSDFKAFIVDDKSTDNSAEIIEKAIAGDDRFELIKHSKNQGVSGARNTGICAAFDDAAGQFDGKYILFLDPDDTYELTLLEKLNESLKDKPVDIIFYGHTEDYKKEDGTISYQKKINVVNEEDSSSDLREIHKRVMDLEKATMLGYPWNKAYKLSIINKRSLGFREIKHIEDILFNVDYFEHVESITVLPDILYHYRNQGQVRLTGGKIDKYFELQKLRVKAIMKQQQDWGTLDKKAMEILAGIYFRSFQSHIVRQLDEKKKKQVVLDIESEKEDVLYKSLKGYLNTDSSVTRVIYKPLADGDFKEAVSMAAHIRAVKKYAPGLFNRAKQKR